MKTFDDLDNELTYGDQPPFQFREKKDNEGTLDWLNNNFDKVYEESVARLLMYRRYISRYKNYDTKDGDGFVKTSNRDRGTTARKPRVRVNFFYNLVEQKVSQVSRMKVNTVFIPKNDSEQDDRNNATACNLLAKHRAEELKFDYLMRDMDRKTFMFGTSFAYIYWDESAGPLDPTYEEAKKKYPDGKIPKINLETGEVTGYYTKPVHVGDVCMEIKTPECIFPEREKYEWKDVDHIDHIEWMHIEKVKALYPKKAKEIEVNSKVYFSYERQENYVPDDMVMVRTFWHRPTEFFPEGCKIVYCDSTILEWTDFPYEHGQLPFVPDFDIEVPGELWARPFLVNIEQLNNMYDIIQSGVARNMGVASHPKLLVPEGSIDIKQADNEYGVLQFRGPTPPQWLQHNYVNRGEFDIQDRLEKKMGQFGGVFEISQGYVPTGVTAYSAIRYLDDQEVQRNSNTISKRRERILSIYRQMISLMAQYYTAQDGRTIKILGKNNEYLIKSFKDFDFKKIYDVKLENVSALSDTRSGRIADIMDLNASNQKNPLFGPKEITKLLDLGLDEAFKDESSYAADTARTILEMLTNGEEPEAPLPTDDLVEMYMIFSRYVESIAYRFKLNPEYKAKLNDYIAGMEFMMWDKASKNMAFASQVLGLAKFPMFFQMPGPIQPPMPIQPTTPSLDTSKMTNTREELKQEVANQGDK